MTAKIYPFNVRGLGNLVKKEQIFTWLKEKQYSICLLQETHVTLMTAKICSFNVRGLGNLVKREQMFTWLKEKQYSICLLQETHSGEGTHDLRAREWDTTSYINGMKNNSEGVAILLNPNFSYTVKEYKEIIIGRLQGVEIAINDKDLVILNLYGPNTDDLTHFNTLEKYL